MEEEKRNYSQTLKATSVQCQKVAADSASMGKELRNRLLEILISLREVKDTIGTEKLLLREKIEFLELETQSFSQSYSDICKVIDQFFYYDSRTKI